MAWMDNVGEISQEPLSLGDFMWTLPNLFFWFEEEKKPHGIASPWFTFQDEKFRIVLATDFLHVGLFIWWKTRKNNKERFKIEILLNSTCNKESFPVRDPGNNKRTRYYPLRLEFVTNPSKGEVGKWEYLPLPSFKSWSYDISPEGRLTISCKITSLTEHQVSADARTNTSSENSTDSEELPIEKNIKKDEPGAKGVERLLQNLEKLLLDGKNSDVVLKVDNCEFAVHRGLLSVRSPVFASMFEHDMAEKHSEAIDIPDCSSEAFKVFLHYLYTGSANGVIAAKNVFDLFYVSDKYQVDDLKEECVEFIKKTLSVDTFCEVLSLSLLHNESELLIEATNFFRDNMRKIIKTVQWQTYLQKNPLYANELLIKALNS